MAFTTANRIDADAPEGIVTQRILREDLMDAPFRACAEAVEEAILNSLAAAETTVGFEGTKKIALADLWKGARHA